MKKKDFLWSLLTIVMVGLLSVGLSSCGDEDDDEIILDSPLENPEYTFYRIFKDDCSTYYYDDKEDIRRMEAYGHLLPDIPDLCGGSKSFNAKTGELEIIFHVTRLYSPSKIIFDSSVSNYEFKSLSGFFAEMPTLKTIEGLEYLNTSKVTDMSFMFYNTGLTSIDLSSFDTKNVQDMEWMFRNCPSLTTIYVGDKWDTSNIQPNESMFYGCDNLVGGMGTKKEKGKDDSSYAHVDGGASNPGYMTYKAKH